MIHTQIKNMLWVLTFVAGSAAGMIFVATCSRRDHILAPSAISAQTHVHALVESRWRR